MKIVRFRYLPFIIPLSCALSGVSALLAQPVPPATTPSAAPPPAKAKPRVYFFGRTYARNETLQGQIQTCRGDAIFRITRQTMPASFFATGKDPLPLTGDDSRLTTDLATYNEKTQIASSPGKLKLEDENNTLTGNTGTAFYRTKDAKIRGDVVIVARPREEDRNAPEGSSQRQFDAPVTLTCQKVDYNWRTRIAFASEQLTMKQKDRVVTADRAIYDGKKETIVLEGNVVYNRSNGEKFKADKVTIVFTKGKEQVTAEKTGGEYPINEDELDESERPPSGDNPATPPANPGPLRPNRPGQSPSSVPPTTPSNTPKEQP